MAGKRKAVERPIECKSPSDAVYQAGRRNGKAGRTAYVPVRLDMQNECVVLDEVLYERLVASGIGYDLLYWYDFDGGHSGVLAVPMA